MKNKRGIIIPIVLVGIALLGLSSLGFLMFHKNIQNKQVDVQTSSPTKTEVMSQLPKISPSPHKAAAASQEVQAYIWGPVCQSSDTKNFQVRVGSGDSQTTISRQAIEQYFNEVSLTQTNSTLLHLDGEESVYAEDYIRKVFTFSPLTVNSTISIPCAIVENATLEARDLTIKQKGNLEKYKNNATELKVQDIIQKNMQELCKDSPDMCEYSGVLSF